MRCERLILDRLGTERGADNFRLHRLEEKERLPPFSCPMHSTDKQSVLLFFTSVRSPRHPTWEHLRSECKFLSQKQSLEGGDPGMSPSE